MNKFGDGISWEFHVDQVIDGESVVYYQNEDPNVKEAVACIKTSTKIEDRKAVDCGCLIGRWIDVIRHEIKDYTGVDQCTKALEAAKERKPYGTWVHSMLWDMKFNEEFDFACTIAVLQHNMLAEQEKIIPAIYRALKPGGIMLNMESTVHVETSSQRTHDGWVRMIESHGFKLVKSMHKNELGLEDAYIFIKQ